MELVLSDIRGALTAMSDPGVAQWWTGALVVALMFLFDLKESSRASKVLAVGISSAMLSILPGIVLALMDGIVGDPLIARAWQAVQAWIVTIAFSQGYYHAIWKTAIDMFAVVDEEKPDA